MNAIISLCHFCELHGPRVVFNTQAFRDPPSLANLNIDSEFKETDEATEEENLNWKYGRIKDDIFKPQASFITDTCSACRSFPHNQAAIITNDHENGVSFVSSQYPFQEEIFTLLRQAGIRSLSCEVYSEREGPIYFGDHTRGHVISYTFFLKDIQARGFLRRYSVLVMMADKMFILNSWSFFIKYLKDVIVFMQDLAAKVYSSEESLQSHSSGFKSTHSHDNNKRHREAGNPRPLTDLVGDKSIWSSLHTRFTWILKAGGMRLQEKLIEVPPLLVHEMTLYSTNLQSLMEVVGSSAFQDLIHHIYVGNKVILESVDEAFLQDIVIVLKPIVPLYLYHPLHVTSPYESCGENFENANIITVSSHPPTSTARHHFTLQFIPFPPERDSESSTQRLRYDVQVMNPSQLKARPPQIVSKIISLIEKGRLSPSVLNLYFASLIDEWTNKVRIWSYLSQNKDMMNAPPPALHLLSPGTTSPSSHEKRGLLNRSPSPTSCSPSNMLLTVVGALECDVPMLTALSVAFEKYGS